MIPWYWLIVVAIIFGGIGYMSCAGIMTNNPKNKK